MFKLGLAALPLIPGGGYGSSHFGGCCAAAHCGRGTVVLLMLGGGGWPRYCSFLGGVRVGYNNSHVGGWGRPCPLGTGMHLF